MIPKEILKKIRRIEIRTGKLVNEIFAGQYSSVFKGRGMEFAEVREYIPGDDVRSIDWNVTARYGRPFIKKYVEERELTVMFMVDGSASKEFGTREVMKRELAAEVTACLAFSAIRNNDKVGLIVATDQVEKFVPPKKGRPHVLRVIREILYYQPQRKGTDLNSALEYLGRVMSKRCVGFLVSDFLTTGFEKRLKIISRRHDIIALDIADAREENLNRGPIIELEDAETGRVVDLDLNDEELRKVFEEKAQLAEEEKKGFFGRMGIDRIRLLCGEPYADKLVKFFRIRAKRFR